MRMRTRTTGPEGQRADADPYPHEHGCRRLRDHTGRVVGADHRSGLRLRQGPGHPGVPRGCEAALIGRTTFGPALTSDGWPWPDLNVFVLCSQRPPGTPARVVSDHDRARLRDKLRAANRGGDVHLVGAPARSRPSAPSGRSTRSNWCCRCSCPLQFGVGMRLTPSLSPDTGLTFERERALPGGSVEIVYDCQGQRDQLPGRPASQRA